MSAYVSQISGGAGVLRSSRLEQLSRQAAAVRHASPAAAGRAADRVDVDIARAAAARAQSEPVRMARVAEAGLGEVTGLLDDVRELVKTAGPARQTEVDALLSDVDRVSTSAEDSGVKLLDGSATITHGALRLKIPAANTASLGKVRAGDREYRLGDLRSGGDLAGVAGGLASQVVDTAAAEVSRTRKLLSTLAGDAPTSNAGNSPAAPRASVGSVIDMRG